VGPTISPSSKLVFSIPSVLKYLLFYKNKLTDDKYLETVEVPSPLPPVVAAHARSAKLPPSPWSFPTSSSPSTTYVVVVMELVHVNVGAPTAPIPLEQRHLTSTHPQLWPPPSSSPSAAAVEAKTEHTILTAHLRRLARAGSLDEIDAFLAPQRYSPLSSLPLPRTSTSSSACCHNIEEVCRLHESSRPDPRLRGPHLLLCGEPFPRLCGEHSLRCRGLSHPHHVILLASSCCGLSRPPPCHPPFVRPRSMMAAAQGQCWQSSATCARRG
jgi:hypothetical protein